MESRVLDFEGNLLRNFFIILPSLQRFINTVTFYIDVLSIKKMLLDRKDGKDSFLCALIQSLFTPKSCSLLRYRCVYPTAFGIFLNIFIQV